MKCIHEMCLAVVDGNPSKMYDLRRGRAWNGSAKTAAELFSKKCQNL
jgi:hypothetical protein